MAIIKCIECGKEVSSKALNCPHCGCPVEETIKTLEAQKNETEGDCMVNGEWCKLSDLAEMIYNEESYPALIQMKLSNRAHLEIESAVQLYSIIKDTGKLPKEFNGKAIEIAQPAYIIKCPTCGSGSVKKLSNWNKSWLNGTLNKTFECEHCGYTW